MIAWSYSRLKEFEQCPLKFYLQSITKDIPFEETPQIVKGKRLHKDLEDYINNVRSAKDIDPVLESEVALIEDLRSTGFDIKAEYQICFDKHHNRVDWFYKRTYVRTIIDALCVKGDRGFVIDWKTGKFYPDVDQVKLMICMLFLENKTMHNDDNSIPLLEKIGGGLFYLQGKQTSDIVTIEREEYMDIYKEFELRAYGIKRAHIQNKWEPTPNKFCNWCGATCKQCPHKK